MKESKLTRMYQAIALFLAVMFCGNVYAQGTGQYVLEAGDSISLQVFNEPDLTMEAIIGQSGTINFSYLGEIQVAGKTAEELANTLTEKLRDGYIKNPSVNVTVKQYRAFYVDGEVRSPGSYSYEPGLTVAKAVSLGGGMTDRANRKKILLIREIDGEKKRYTAKMDTPVHAGDVITVQEGWF